MTQDPEKTLEAVAKAIGTVRAKNLGRDVWLMRAAAAAVEAYEEAQKPTGPHGYTDGVTRRDQIKEGSLNRWKAEFGLTEAEVYEAREISRRTKFHMHEACRMVQRANHTG